MTELAVRARRWRVSLGLALAIVLDTVGQLLWKQAAAGLPAVLSPEALLRSVLHDPLPVVVLGVFLLQLVNWLSVLRQPISATRSRSRP